MNVGSYSNVPEELRLLPNWVLWRLEDVGKTKPSKIPYQINGRKASSTDPSTWSTFEIAFNAFQMGGYDGLGFCFGNSPYSGIDLDDPSFLKDGSANPDYQNDLNRQIRIAHEFDSYSEISPSGKGLHIIVKGKAPDGKNNRAKFVEVYPGGRYFTMTGQVHNNAPIKDYQELLVSLWQELGGQLNPSPIIESGPETSSDEELLALARKHNAATFAPLELAQWEGAYPSQSEADLAYMNIIAYYTNNKEQVKRIYSNSKLALTDPKRKTKRYQNITVNEAFNLKPPLVKIEDWESVKAASSNGRTPPFDGENVGSNPAAVANLELPPGLLGDIASFIYQAAPRPVPEVALAAAIGLMSGMCGRAYNISGTGLNQYVLLLAMTGAGKEAAASGINKLMNKVKDFVPTSTGFIGPSEISSGAALFKYLGHTSQSFISLLGEFGLRLQQMSSPNANGSEVSLRRMLLDLYNKSGFSEVLQASVYSDKANNTSAIPSPSFSILGESTPERFYGALNEDMISEGLLPRFLLIEYKGDRPELNEFHSSVVPSFTLIERLSALAAQCEGINYSNPRRNINVQSTPEAAKKLREFDKYSDSQIRGSRKDVIRQLWNRAHIKVLKLSALIAVGENMLEPTINSIHMEWAAKLVYADIAALTERFEAGEIGSNSFELKQANEALRILKEYLEKDAGYIIKYGGIASQQKDNVVNKAYLHNRLGKLAPFLNDRLGGSAALKRTLQNLVDAGKIVELKGSDLAKFKTYGVLYFIKSFD